MCFPASIGPPTGRMPSCPGCCAAAASSGLEAVIWSRMRVVRHHAAPERSDLDDPVKRDALAGLISHDRSYRAGLRRPPAQLLRQPSERPCDGQERRLAAAMDIPGCAFRAADL